jgi:hypothetical protein
MYHVVNGLVVLEYLLVLFFKPELKAFQNISAIGMCYSTYRPLSFKPGSRHLHGCLWTNFAFDSYDSRIYKFLAHYRLSKASKPPTGYQWNILVSLAMK